MQGAWVPSLIREPLPYATWWGQKIKCTFPFIKTFFFNWRQEGTGSGCSHEKAWALMRCPSRGQQDRWEKPKPGNTHRLTGESQKEAPHISIIRAPGTPDSGKGYDLDHGYGFLSAHQTPCRTLEGLPGYYEYIRPQWSCLKIYQC